MSELVARGLAIRSFNRESRTLDFVASTDAIDSYDEVVEQDWILDRYLANPVVLFAHNSRELPIGKSTRTEVVTENGRLQLECTIQLASAKANPLAEQVFNGFAEGTLCAVSVGFLPGDYRFEKRNGVEVFVLSKNTLHEISVVPIPANPEALAKMKSKARAASTSSPAVEASTENVMNEKEMLERMAKADAEKALAEKQVADLHSELASTKNALGVVEATVKTLEGDRDGFKARAEKAEASVIDSEIDALVGKKIAPAEKAEFVELRKSNPDLFKRMVAARPDMKLLAGPVIGDDKAPLSAVVDIASSSNGDELASKIFSS